MLTHRGVVPPTVSDGGWGVRDIADLGLNRWVLLEGRYNGETGTIDHRSAGVYTYGKWAAPIAPAVWQAELPGAAINRDATYLWRAPNIAENPNEPPLPPQKAGAVGTGYTNMDSSIGIVKHHGPSQGLGGDAEYDAPGTLGWNETWTVLDGSPTRWAKIQMAIRYRLQVQGGGESISVPLHGVLDVNGQTFEVPGWQPWSTWTPFDATSRAMWAREGGDVWTRTNYWADAGTESHQMYAVEVGLGTRYAVAVSNDSSDGSVWVVAADRTRGTSRVVAIPTAHVEAGPLVRGNTAIFYIRNYLEDLAYCRVLFDLVTMTWKLENLAAQSVIQGGIYAPSYMSDVPRIMATQDGSGTDQRRVEMDNDSVPIASGQHISYSGNNIILRVYGAPARGLQSSEPAYMPIEVVTWTPDSNLAGGDETRKGYFQ